MEGEGRDGAGALPARGEAGDEGVTATAATEGEPTTRSWSQLSPPRIAPSHLRLVDAG